MIPAFRTLYSPMTSRPFLRDRTYAEHAPCRELRPYVACFWETGPSVRQVLVIPDTCIDIIIEINHTRQRIKSRICGIQDYSVTAGSQRGREDVTVLAVRFYFWAARLFLDLNMRDIYNQVMDLDLVQPGCAWNFEPLFYLGTTSEKISWLERYLLNKLEPDRYNTNLYNSIDFMLSAMGNTTVKEICGYSSVSQRQMERLFLREIGMPIKRTASLVRYQNVWREVASRKEFEIQDAVYRYGYTDQAHLLKDFRRFHSVPPEQARQIALASR